MVLCSCAAWQGEPANLHGHWSLVSVDGESVQAKGKLKNTAFTMVLDQEGNAHGKVACNNWRATYAVADNTLRVSRAMTTRAFCLMPDEHLKTVEQSFLGAMTQARIMAVSDSSLILVSQQGQEWEFSR